MATSWYIVIHSGGQWWVDHEGRPYGPYRSLAEASDGAVRLARLQGDERDWEVFAPGHDHRHRRIAARADADVPQPPEEDD